MAGRVHGGEGSHVAWKFHRNVLPISGELGKYILAQEGDGAGVGAETEAHNSGVPAKQATGSTRHVRDHIGWNPPYQRGEAKCCNRGLRRTHESMTPVSVQILLKMLQPWSNWQVSPAVQSSGE